MQFEALRSNRRAFIGLTLAVAVPGLFLGPAIMEPAYVILQPQLGGMTLLAVEILFALIIDFPLATISSVIICRSIRSDDPADGALAGAFFLLVFGVLIVACIALSPVGGPLIESLALSEVISPATATAVEALGGTVVALLVVLFAIFDLALCSTGGIVGYHASRAYRRGPRRT